jgi:hypothetical protein
MALWMVHTPIRHFRQRQQELTDMAFMEPVYEHGEFVLVENHGESSWTPAGYEDDNDTIVERATGWFCQLSASGYMDQTGWDGPFKTEDEARDHIRDTFDVDPDTGDDLTDEDEDEEDAA